MAMESSRPCVMAGDWNEEFADPLSRVTTVMAGDIMTAMAVQQHGLSLPSRWRGNICIDWLITSVPVHIEQMKYLEDKWSAHRAFQFMFVFTRPLHCCTVPITTRMVSRPPSVSQ